MNLLPKITLTLTLVLAPAITLATEGKVIAYKSSCHYLVIESAKGYLLLKQQGTSSYTPKKGDQIEGFFLENYGVTHLHKLSSNEVLWVYNENTWLTKTQAQQNYAKKCES